VPELGPKPIRGQPLLDFYHAKWLPLMEFTNVQKLSCPCWAPALEPTSPYR
jgi:hypothetical protein